MSEELERRVDRLEQKANNDNNMVLKKAPNFANRLVEAFERIEALEVRTHTDISDLGARLTGMEKAYEPPNSTDADDATATGAHAVDGDVVGVDAVMEDARLYCENAGYWRGRTERAEAERDDYRQIARTNEENAVIHHKRAEQLQHDFQCVKEQLDYTDIERGTYKHSAEIAEKELAELKQERAEAKLEEVLKNIADPIACLEGEAKRMGCILDGSMAIKIASDANYLRDIARDALKAIENARGR